MSGLGGHMPHIHEDYNLTFFQLKKILKELSNGNTTGTEKLDGQNLYISYSLSEGCAKAARNKTNIKDGGLNSAELASKFFGRGDLESSFNDAFARFEEVVSKMSDDEKRTVFGESADIYYNVEIIDPRTQNIIEYNTTAMVIHRSNHICVNGKHNFNKLEEILNRVNSFDHKVVTNPIRKIGPLSESKTVEYLSRIDAAYQEVGLKETSTIAEYLVHKCLPKVMELGLSKEKNSSILKRLVTRKFPNLNEIKKGLTAEQKKSVSRLINDKSTVRDAMFVVESVLHDFSVSLLSTFTSGYSNNTGGKGLYERFVTAKSKIETSEYDKARSILKLNMSKISQLEDVIFETEGFVFNSGDMVYKITGNFAPVNQILGLFTFGRGEVPPLREVEEKEEDPKPEVPSQKIAVFPGAFKPPHMGHLKVVDHFLEDKNVDKVVVLISDPSSRQSQRSISPARDITANDSKEIWEKMTSGRSGIEIVVSSAPSPVSSTFEYIGEDGSAPKNATILLASSDKDNDSRFRSVERYARGDLDVVVDTIPSTNHSTSYMQNLSQDKKILNDLPSLQSGKDPSLFHASDMRYLIGLAQEGNKNATFLLGDFLPENVIQYVLRLFSVDLSEDFQSKMKKRLSKSHVDLLDQGGQPNSSPYNQKRPKDKSNAFLAKEEEELEEISAMGAGAVSGYSAPVGQKKRKKRKKNPNYKD